MSDERDKIVRLHTRGHQAPIGSTELADDLKRIEMMRNDFRSVTKQLRLGTAAQLVAAARELIDGEPGYLDDCRFLDELEVQLQSDSV